MAFSSVPEILEELKAGRMIVLVDDEGRENEGDLCVAAEMVTADAINFMARFGRGLVCLAMSETAADALALPPMAEVNTSHLGTAFTVSIDAHAGITTGISAADRARTILAAVADGACPDDLVRPGHVFPLRARDGGVLVRAGQTEGVVDLCKLAGLKPAGVICEVMNEDGTMARLGDLKQFVSRHDLKMCSVAQVISYRGCREKLVTKSVTVKLPTRLGQFDLHLYRSVVDPNLHLALTVGGIGTEDAPDDLAERAVMTRVHSECLTGDLFESLRCDCGAQLRKAMEIISAEGLGVLLYMRQEGRGIGLEAKLHAYRLQEDGLDTVEANEKLGFPPDKRDYGIGAQILVDLGVRNVRLLTNNPRKMVGLEAYGLKIVERLPLVVGGSVHNRKYLRTKRDKLGHIFDEDE